MNNHIHTCKVLSQDRKRKKRDKRDGLTPLHEGIRGTSRCWFSSICRQIGDSFPHPPPGSGGCEGTRGAATSARRVPGYVRGRVARTESSAIFSCLSRSAVRISGRISILLATVQ